MVTGQKVLIPHPRVSIHGPDRYLLHSCSASGHILRAWDHQ